MQVASLPQVKSFSSYRCSADILSQLLNQILAFSVLTLLIGWQEGHPACKKTCLSGGVLAWLSV